LSGSRIIAGSLIAGLCGIGPLALYILFGPADGNPVGLGLLAAVTVPVVGVGLAVGFVKMLIELFVGRGR
jgi:hypothetical protein